MKRRGLALILATAMVAGSLTGCGGTGNTDTPAASNGGTSTSDSNEPEEKNETPSVQQSQTSTEVESAHVSVVNIASDRDPTDMGPWAGNMGGASAQIPLVYQTLQIMELNGEREPCLAKTVTQVDEYTYDVELFDYIHDSLGNPLTANDIKFGVEKAQEIGRVAAVKVVDSIEVTDDTHFTVHFTDAFSMGDGEGFFCQTFFVTQAAYEADGNNMAQNPIGTAAYKVKEYVGGSHFTFVKDENFWQTDEQYLARSSEVHADEVNFVIVTEAAQRAIGVETGTLDYASVTLSDKARLESEGYEFVAVPDNLTYMLFMNMDETSAVANNKELREALYYALDNQGISDLYTSADSVPVYDLSNSNYPDYYEDDYKAEDNYYQFDLEKAKELLAQSGFDTNQKLTLICSSDEGSNQVAEILKNYWTQLGITNIDIQSYQGNLMSDVAADPGNWDIYLLQYASTDYAVNVWEKVLNKAKYSWGGTINFVMDDTLQEMLANCRTEEGHTKENIIAFHDYIVDGAWAMGLIQGVQYYACSSIIDTQNVVMSDQRIIRPNATIYKEVE
jgi:ABC-type transport system substrate-binding protein